MVAAPAAPEHGHHGGPGGAPAGDHESPSREAPDRGASCEVVTHCAVPMPEQACVGALDGPPRTSPNDLDDAAPISPTGEPDSPPPRG